jgi:hypothetical protein
MVFRGSIYLTKERHLKNGETSSKPRNAFENSIHILSVKCK